MDVMLGDIFPKMKMCQLSGQPQREMGSLFVCISKTATKNQSTENTERQAFNSSCLEKMF